MNPTSKTSEQKTIKWWLASLTILFLFEAGILVWRSYQIGALQDEVFILRQKVDTLETLPILSRRKRQVEPNNLNEDGLPIRQGSYTGDQGDTEGLRIYDAWFQHRNAQEIPKSRSGPLASLNSVKDGGDPIKPHHRTSAAWVEKRRKSSHDLNAHFDKKVFRDQYPSRRRTNSGSAIDMPQTNFYKITPTEEPTVNRRWTTTPRPAISQLPIKRPIEAQNATTRMTYQSNRNLVRSGNNHQHRDRRPLARNAADSVSSLADQFEGLKAIHFVGEKGKKAPDHRVFEGEGNQLNDDGVFRHWAPARWATRMHVAHDFPLDADGRVGVKKSGLYLIYAQINYLDEHDVNAFQVYINDDPYLLCTVMTHTRHPTTKANTCFTSGVAFLEAEDQILIRDLEPMRQSVIRPAHTFFGLIQLSSN